MPSTMRHRAGRDDDGAVRDVLDLQGYVPYFLTAISNAWSRSSSRLYLDRFGVGVTEWRVMALLAMEAPIPAARICQVIGLDKGPVSRCLSAMQEAGLVRVKPDRNDARLRPVALTATGRRLHDRIIKLALEREDKLLSCLKAAERKTLLALLNRLHANLEAVER